MARNLVREQEERITQVSKEEFEKAKDIRDVKPKEHDVEEKIVLITFEEALMNNINMVIQEQRIMNDKLDEIAKQTGVDLTRLKK